MLEVEVRKQRGDFLCEVAFTSATPGVTALLAYLDFKHSGDSASQLPAQRA